MEQFPQQLWMGLVTIREHLAFTSSPLKLTLWAVGISWTPKTLHLSCLSELGTAEEMRQKETHGDQNMAFMLQKG